MSSTLTIGMTLTQCWHRVPGGTASAANGLATALSQRDDVDVVGFGPGGRRMPRDPWTPTVPIKRLCLPYQLLYDVWHHSPACAPSQRVRGLDLVHATSVMTPPRGNVPLVVTINDLFALTAPHHFTERGVRIMQRGVEMAKRRADLVVCPSLDTVSDCVDAGFDESKIRVVPWAAQAPAVSEAYLERVRHRFRLRRRFVLWVGTVEPRKNLPTLIDAFAQADIDGVELVLVGPTGWHEQLEGHIEPVAHKVRHLGSVSDAELSALYSLADVVAFPSLREGFGLPAAEAIAHGTPVIGSAGTAIEEVVGDAGLLADPLDTATWVTALRQYFQDQGLREALAQACPNRAKRFTWENTAQQMMMIYRELA